MYCLLCGAVEKTLQRLGSSDAGALLNAKYPFIVIAHRSTEARNGRTDGTLSMS